MADAVFCRMFASVLNTSQKYCKLCLRTENEINLVKPNYVKKLLDVVEIINLDLTDSLVCSFCEARSAAAERVIHTLMFARDTATLLATASTSRVYCRQMSIYCQGKKTALNAGLRRVVSRCEARVVSVRLPDLCRTETLIIDSTTDKLVQSKKSKNADGTNLGEIVISDDSDDECVVLHQPKIQAKPIEQLLDKTKNRSNSPEQVLSDIPPKTILINDGNIDTNSGKILISPSNIDKVTGNIIIPTANIEGMTGSIIIPSDLEGGIVIPTANLTPNLRQTNSMSNNIQILPIAQTNNFFNLSNKTPKNASTSELFYVVEDGGMSLYPLNETPINITQNNTQIAQTNTISVIKQTDPQIFNPMPIITNTTSLDESTSKTNSSEQLIILSDNEINDIIKKRAETAKRTSEMEQQVKRLATSPDTDWEDKIPMDVISFTDSTEPICAIESVRSVR